MTGDNFEKHILNLETVTAALLGDKADGRRFDTELLAEALMQKHQSRMLMLSLVGALIREDADYRLVIVENTRKHPGGVPRMGAWRDKMQKAHDVATFVREQEARHGKREAAVSEAKVRFNMSRSTVFEYLALANFLDGLE